jgi:hypothetical protein
MELRFDLETDVGKQEEAGDISAILVYHVTYYVKWRMMVYYLEL